MSLRNLNKFNTISLEEMGKVRLMNRIDTKYVTTIGNIALLLQILADNDYFVQEIDGRTNMPYYTKYYDTADAQMFYQHQRGKKTRQKVRVRKYEGSDTPSFIEIKSKNNKGRTNKKRVKFDKDKSLAEYKDFFDAYSIYPPEVLIPQIENHFFRITLINREMTERITIDTNLQFHNLVTDRRADLSNIGIIEWKRDGRKCNSRFDTFLRTLRIHQSGFSKYCIGMAITNPDLRQNRLKKRLRMVDRINKWVDELMG